ncbi:MAG TPA: alpha/beta fold hydrolase [Ignavibacteria bacterium]|nr:alpha/beta fold hydrolase [Ignavibacteria bacterium]
MRKKLFLFAILVFALSVIFPTKTFSQNNALKGRWLGTLNISGIELHLVFNVTEKAGKYNVTMDSPDQGVKGIQVNKVTYANNKVRFDVASVNGFFEGEINKGRNKITGKWKQGANKLPIVLEKTDKEYKLDRPQEPKKPFPYISEDVTFKNNKDGITLAGTLTLPKGKSPFTAVVLITGSGPQNRDEEILGHKPFLVISDYLTRNGIAVLRYDDRGIGKSEGEFPKATSLDFAEDVFSAVQYLETRKEINPEKIGLIGHSEGGLIAPMVAVRTNDVAFIVLLAGPGLPGSELITLQAELISRANGENEKNIKLGKDFNTKVFNEINTQTDNAELKITLDKMFSNFYDGLSKDEKEKTGSKKSFMLKSKTLLSPWFRYFLKYDPRPTLEKVKCPVLALNGGKDLQVPAKEDLMEIEKALKKGGNKNYKIVMLPGLNHLFQTAKTGSPSEYSKITETFSPKALKIIKNWILKVTQ